MKKLFLLFICLAALTLPLHASQNALVVPDGTGAQVRAGFNNALDTLNTVNSGPAAPATTEAYMLWADTANNLLKQRDAANATWIILGTLGVAQMGHEPAITPGATSQYWRGDKTWQTLPSGMSYPGAGVPLSTGSAWGASYIVGTGANDLVQLNSSGQLPAVSGALLTNLPSSGGMTNLGTTTIAAATTTISGLSPGGRYKIILNLEQNTSVGAHYIQFNSDAGANYGWATSGGGPGGSALGGASSGANYVELSYGSISTSSYAQYELTFQTVTGNNDEVQVSGTGGFINNSSGLLAVTNYGQYMGSASLSSITIGTTAGTLTGTAVLYQLN